MHKSSKTRWGGWSDWIWNEDYQRYYRQRQNTNGEYDTEWNEATATTADEQTPRDSNIDGITEGLQNVELQNPSSSAFDHQPSEYTHRNSSSKNKSKSSKSKSSKSKSTSKGKGKSHADPEGEEELDHASAAGSSHPTTADVQDQPCGATSYAEREPALTSQGGVQYTQTRYDEEEEDPAIQAAIAASRGYNYSAQATGEGSDSAYGTYDYEDEGPPTPRAAGSRSTHIAATDGDAEQLDPRYRVEHSNKFGPGEIFKVLWCEPQGSGYDPTPSVSDRHEYKDRFGGKFYVGFRRFIVIANDQGHCTCVPILTYGGKACSKKGIKPEKHGIVYEKGHKARLLSGEPKLGFAPARVEITQDGEKLSKESRVNYSKLVTVEHNVKVLFIGRVTAVDYDIVADAVNKCWEEKIHHKRRFSSRGTEAWSTGTPVNPSLYDVTRQPRLQRGFGESKHREPGGTSAQWGFAKQM
ncbi:hypothetical protein AK830_g2987 [Neonectria ditissima]|uniref:DUF6590 domain-containing protein n=1 Tax=Neonectria ditissima TaxID=78410 RepID=A0A0P7BQY6_9HYPO|nr:hypothetical protein AK830_g2987 [Neonectria ditissima]